MSAIEIAQFACLSDNYGYLVHDPESGQTACIDTPETGPIFSTLDARGWTLSHIWNTHHHFDHAGNNLEIKEKTGCQIIGPAREAERIPGIDVKVDDGDTVKLGYVDQSRDDLDNSKTVWEVISDGLDEVELGKRTMASRAYVGQFNFKGGDQQKRVGQLSGGERNRVHLARMLKSGANLLLLDEPTNDLDVDTLRALEEALEEFAGCAVVVSHDRWFLDRIATHILAFEGNSHVEWFEGNYEAYEADRKRRLGAEADRPTRIKYKPISR